MKATLVLLLSLCATQFTFAQTSKVFCLYPDNDTLWVGTFGGLVKYNIKADSSFCYTMANSGLPSDKIQSLAKDSKDNLWVGCYTSGVGYFKNGTCNTMFPGTNTPVFTGQYCAGMYVDKNDTVYFGSIHSLKRIYNNQLESKTIGSPTSSDYQTVRKIVEAPDGSHILATDFGLQKYENGKMSLIKNMTMKCNALKYDRSGNLWIGTEYNGLYKLTNDSLINYNTSNSDSPSKITGIVIDKNDNIWLPLSSPEKTGLINFKETGNSKFYNNVESGYSLQLTIENGDSCIWIGTIPKGLYRFSLSTETFYKVELSSGDLSDVPPISSANELKIYPVPVQDILNVHIPPCSSYKINIHDMTGKPIYVSAWKHSSQTNDLQTINTSFLTKGIYFLQLKTDNGTYSKKLTK
ncbi:MAG: two-component regulator propeller domain-containing protein [Paludibacter sp.]|nr:two-component regulator propeller domain-containing protein [Paludibacter sp.]